MDQIDFNGKVVIVTGASSGIGAETAKLFASYKATLVLIGRKEKRLSSVAKECHSRSNMDPMCLLLDLKEKDNCEAVVRKAFETYGRIDVLINCAGRAKIGSLFDQTIDNLDDMMNINLRVPYLLTQLSLPHLIKTKGNVINVGTWLNMRHKPGFLPYSVSKAALETFTKQAAAELASVGVRVNIISPGVTRTNMLDNFNINSEMKNHVYEFIAEHLPTRTVIEPKEVATLIVLTASGVFPHLNGANLTLDGAASVS